MPTKAAHLQIDPAEWCSLVLVAVALREACALAELLNTHAGDHIAEAIREILDLCEGQ